MNKQYHTGHRVPATGIYRSIGMFSGARSKIIAMDIMLNKGQTFPPVKGYRGGVIWELSQLI